MAAWQPNGLYGLLVGWTSNLVYEFDGSWHMTYLPVPNGAAPSGIAFRADGNRALIVGRAIGVNLAATVLDYQPGARAYDGTAWVDQSIPNFSTPPWSGNSNMTMLDVACPPRRLRRGPHRRHGQRLHVQPHLRHHRALYDAQNPACAP